MANVSTTEHLIHRLQVEVENAGQPVTFRTLYSHSGRKRADLADALLTLVEDGIVGVIEPPEGAIGRPTKYFYLKNVWVPDPSASPLDPHNRLVPSEEPNPHVEREFSAPKANPLLDFTVETPDLFSTLGPRIVRYVETHSNVSNESKIIEYFTSGSAVKSEQVSRIFNRLANPAYDEYYTEFGLVRHKSLRADGARDRRVAGGTGETYGRRGLGAAITDKAERMHEAQRRRYTALSKSSHFAHLSEEELLHYLQFPEPNDDLPDMSRFEHVYDLIAGEQRD